MLPTTSTTTTAEELLTISATKPTPPITPSIASTRPASVVTTPLATTPHRTTLVEMTTRPNRLKPILESSLASNRTVTLETYLVSNKTTFLETLSLVPIKTTLLESSSSVTTTTMEPTTIRTTTSPVRTTTTLKVITENTSTTVATPKVIATTTIATTVIPANNTMKTVTSISITEGKPTEEMKIDTKIARTTSKIDQTTKNTEMIDKVPLTTTTELEKLTTTQNYLSVTTNGTTPVEHTTRKMIVDSKYNRTEIPIVPKINIKEQHIPVHIAADTKVKFATVQPKTTIVGNVTEVSVIKTLHKVETTKRPESTIRYFPTTVKFKPKEIWIRPAQKGESYKSKSEANHDLHLKPRVTQPNTTPKTIVVSIIPTSVSYATFKKIALTTASLLSQKMNTTVASPNGTVEQEVTKPMSMLITTESPTTIKLNTNVTKKYLITSKLNKTKELHSPEPHLDRITKTFSNFQTTREFPKNTTISRNGTNSMTTVVKNLNSSYFSITPSTNAIRTKQQNITLETTTVKPTVAKFERVTRPIKIVTVKPRNVTIITVTGKNKNETIVKITKTIAKDIEKTNATRIKDFIKTNLTTESPDGEEFHILTEPEHITAVMEGKGKERTSVDLISVISIAGGIMMAVITVAVIIVMVERCKRPRYDNVRKVSDIRMQVIIDNNDEPPPYVRSIFHTPLPGRGFCLYKAG